MKPAVLCISRDALTKQAIPTNTQGIYPFALDQVVEDQFHFINRAIVDSSHPQHFATGCELPQILAYCVIKCGDEYLTYSRAKGAESRLHGTLSLGFGGHVDLRDTVHPTWEACLNCYAEPYEYGEPSFDNIFVQAICNSVIRELQEELDYPLSWRALQPPHTPFNQIIIDQSNPVGSVHVGLPMVITVVSKDRVHPDPQEIHLPQWQTKEQILKQIDQYENWSKLVIEQLGQ